MTRIAVACGGVSIEVLSDGGAARGSRSIPRQMHLAAVSARKQAGDISIGIILIYV
jgi:hypothetical protein